MEDKGGVPTCWILCLKQTFWLLLEYDQDFAKVVEWSKGF